MATKWGKVNIPEDMLEAIDQYIETEAAKQRGLHNRSEVAMHVVRIFLEKEGVYRPKPRFQVVNHYENNVKLIDNELDRMAIVYFNQDKIYCELCDRQECIHIDYALSLDDVRQTLRSRGFPLKPS